MKHVVFIIGPALGHVSRSLIIARELAKYVSETPEDKLGTRPNSVPGAERNRQAYFKKYDKGWRLARF